MTLDTASLSRQRQTRNLEVDCTGKIRLVNQEAENLFRCNRSELIGRQIDEFVPERFRSGHAVYRANRANKGTTRPLGHRASWLSCRA